MRNSSTSPTFFIAQLADEVKMIPNLSGLKGIRQRYSNIVKRMEEQLVKTFLLKNFEKIEELLNDLYSTYQKDCHEEPYYLQDLLNSF